MDIERPHRTTSTPTTTSELFICFTSRLSNSSSMRLSSKSILSPGRTAAPDKSAASLSLPTSLSRRLRHNGSLKGGASPAMFSSSKKNRGSSGFDNPEPSSPKVTCIGQVRVKTKKQGKKMKMRACRSKRLSGGEASFRRIEHAHEGLTHQNSQGIQNQQQQDCNLPHRNQRWVHLPLTICEALRTFGAEFSCLLPCKSSCFSSCNNEREKGDNNKVREDGFSNNNNNSSNSASNSTSCGAVFRWLVAMQEGEGEGGKGRDIELVVGEEERESRERMVVMERECSRRRSIFDDMDFEDEIFDGKNEDNNGGDDDDDGEGVAARVSVCVPPKNALLLMRCRSDPVKMSALSHKIWEAPVVVNDYEDHDDEDEKEEKEKEMEKEKGDVKEKKTEEVSEVREEFEEKQGFKEVDEMCEDMGLVEETEDLVMVVEENVEVEEMGCEDLDVSIEGDGQKAEGTEEEAGEETEENQSIVEGKTEEKQSIEEGGETEEQEEEKQTSKEEEDQPNSCKIDAILEEEKLVDGEKEQDFAEEERKIEEISENSYVSSPSSCSSVETEEEESTAESEESESEAEVEENDIVEDQEMVVKSMEEEEEEEQEQPLTLTHQRSDPIEPEKTEEEERENDPKLVKEKEGNDGVLPDCLLLMMCEPKLSMEVSKETWVCSTDFVRWLPERHVSNNKNKPIKSDGPDESKKKKEVPPLPPVQPVAQPAVQAGRSSISFPAGPVQQKVVKYEPFVLTRCKSAPIRSAAAAKVAVTAAPEMACSLWGRENSGRRRKMEPHPSAGVGF